MNAEPLLTRVARALAQAGLEAVLIGNAAAALHGAPVTTVDFDFMFRRTPANLARLEAFARELRATILRPHYPVSDLFRVVSDDLGRQVNFLGTIHGVSSFESLRSRAVDFPLHGATLSVAALADIVKSKREAGRPKDHAVLSSLEATLDEPRTPTSRPTRTERLAALKRESELELRDQIRRLLALPMEKRMNFLRVRVGRGTAL